MNDYYFYVAPNEDDLGWEFTISDLIEDEFEERPDNFPTKAAKIEFLKELIADYGSSLPQNGYRASCLHADRSALAERSL